MKDPDLNLEFFKETLAEGDERAVRRALEHLITWHETYRGGVVEEFGISTETFPGLIELCSPWAVTSYENQPGYMLYRRKAGPWERIEKKPSLVAGSLADISPTTGQEL